MTAREKALYHQIHPLKLLTDVGMTFVVVPLFWRHRLIPALLLSFVPSILVSAALIRWADLTPYKDSAVGRYLAVYMTPVMQAVRLLGFGLMALGAWVHRPLFLPLGLLVTLFGWVRGLLFPTPKE